jgi:hypothetical protein
MNIILSIHWVLVASLWFIGNGILHDIFVIMKHVGGYDRELLRLLTVGHILIFSGAVLIVCYLMLLNKIQCGAVISIIIALGMIIFCIMIFPFLKSFVTIFISLMVLIVCIRAYSAFPDIYKIMQNFK